MAKKDEPEEYEFTPPEFDEEAFIHKEMVGFRTTAILFVVGIVAALLSWMLYDVVGGDPTGWFVGLAIVAVFFASLKVLFPKLGADTSHWKRREWIGTGFLFFFTWLAVFILLLNPPFGDHSEPHVEIFVTPGIQEAGGLVSIHFFAADNVAVADRDFAVTDTGGRVWADEDNLTLLGKDHYRADLRLPAGTYTVAGGAHDRKGNDAAVNATFSIRATALTVRARDLPTSLERFEVSVDPAADPWAVYLEHVDGPACTTTDRGVVVGCRIYMVRDPTSDDIWVARSTQAGWVEGNNTVQVVVEGRNVFTHSRSLVEGGRLEAGPYTVHVASPGDSKDSVPKQPNPTQAPLRNVPGLEVVALIGGLVLVAVMRRQR